MRYHKNFTEKEICRAIKNKAPLSKVKKGGKHERGIIEIDGKIVTKITIPNPHPKGYLSERQFDNLAESMLLNIEKFANFIRCSYSSKEYYIDLKTYL